MKRIFFFIALLLPLAGFSQNPNVQGSMSVGTGARNIYPPDNVHLMIGMDHTDKVLLPPRVDNTSVVPGPVPDGSLVYSYADAGLMVYSRSVWQSIGGGSSGGSSYNFDLVRDFGCKPDGVAYRDGTMNAGSPNITFITTKVTSDDIGKAISVRGAGIAGNGYVLVSRIVSITSNNAAVLQNAANNSTTTGIGYFGSDNSTQLTNWARFVANASFSSHTYAPAGIYCIDTAFTASAYGVGQIHVPKVNYLNCHSFELEGAAVPAIGDGEGPGAIVPIPTAGTIFMSLNGGNGVADQWTFESYADPYAGFNFSYCTPIFRKLTIRLLGDYGHNSGIGAFRLANFQMFDNCIDHDVNFGGLSPDVNGYLNHGVEFPDNLSNGNNVAERNQFTGFAAGLTGTEHISGTGNMFFGNYFGVLQRQNNHGSDLGKSLFQWNVYHAAYSSTDGHKCHLSISAMETEPHDYNDGAWYTTIADIYDPTNSGVGVINWHTQSHASTFDADTIKVIGGKNLTINSGNANTQFIGGYNAFLSNPNSLVVGGTVTLGKYTVGKRDSLKYIGAGTLLYNSDSGRVEYNDGGGWLNIGSGGGGGGTRTMTSAQLSTLLSALPTYDSNGTAQPALGTGKAYLTPAGVVAVTHALPFGASLPDLLFPTVKFSVTGTSWAGLIAGYSGSFSSYDKSVYYLPAGLDGWVSLKNSGAIENALIGFDPSPTPPALPKYGIGFSNGQSLIIQNYSGFPNLYAVGANDEFRVVRVMGNLQVQQKVSGSSTWTNSLGLAPGDNNNLYIYIYTDQGTHVYQPRGGGGVQ